jgi:hypothetical protein
MFRLITGNESFHENTNDSGYTVPHAKTGCPYETFVTTVELSYSVAYDRVFLYYITGVKNNKMCFIYRETLTFV